MPPKGKAKAKGKAAAAPPPDVQVLDVPPPPPAPVCLPIPDSMLSRCAPERCLLLSWADMKGAYKVQLRQWIPGDPTERASSADDWRDAKEIERVRMPGRGFHEGRLYACEQIRVQYRMVLASGPKPLESFSVANWYSVPSEPVATFVDPPIGLQAELNCDNDVVPATVTLSWKSSNFESLRSGVAGSPADMDAAFASWPGLMPNKVQVRWRVVRTLSSVDEALPKSLASGSYVVAAALDNLVKDADFRIQEDTWHYTFKEAAHGVIAVFSVRLGTAFKWSPWSEDSAPLVVEVHEPNPPGVARLLPMAELDREAEIDALARSRDSEKEAKTAKCVEIRNLTDSEGEATWMPFTTEGLLTWVEYRVMLCTIEDPDAIPQWDKVGIVAGVVQIQDKVDQVAQSLRGLLPNQWYCVRVDARYPYVGKRAFSNSKALSPPFLTPFPSRPPLQPIPVRLDADEEIEEAQREEDADFRWPSQPWVALRVEKGFFPDKYALQYKDAVAGGEERGKEHFEGWQEPLLVERFAKDKRNSEQWEILRVALPTGAPAVVVLRMMTLTPKTTGPLQWSVASAPVASAVAPPRVAEVQGRTMTLLPTLGGLRLSMRFFLQPGEVLKEGHLQMTQRVGTVTESVGHRYVTQYQLRVRMKGETHKELPAGVKGPRRYLELPATQLPSPHNAVEVNREVLGEPETSEEVEVAGLLGYFGTRYELQAELSDTLWELLMGHDFLEASLRVGTEHRWSAWTRWSRAEGLTVPLPASLARTASAEALGPTAVKVSWPPFDRVPGINSLEYVIRAEPLLAEDGSSGQSLAETVICFKHEPRKQDGQIISTPQFQRLLDVKEMSTLKRLASCFEDIRQREGQEEQETKLQIEMSGLLPWTSYRITVAARYPAGAGFYPRSTMEAKSAEGIGLMVGNSLTTQVETPGGPNTPSAPRQVGWQDFRHDLTEDEMFREDQRAVLLNIEDRKDYVLEYRACAPTWAHYDPEVGPALRDFQGSWPRKLQEEGAWKRVPVVRQLGRGLGESYTAKGIAFTAPEEVIVSAELSDLKPGKGKLPDVVRFRLCARDRSKAHPCCWAGGISEPVPLTFAPPRRPPRIQRILSDDRWNLSFSIELFKANPPPSPIHYLGIEEEDDTDSEEEEEEKELAELRTANFLPEISKASWEDGKLHFMPHGYGHRMVTMVQVRFALQSSILPEMRKALEKDVLDSDWHETSFVEIHSKNLNRSSKCSFELPTTAELLDSGVYVFQVRVGNGKNWSQWSHTSKAFLFQVPPPVAPTAASLKVQRPVNVEVISATAARVVWGDFKPALGLTMLEYEVKATPEQGAGSSKAFPPQTVTFEHRFRGGFIEHELYNLLPFTYYIFSVQARYPKVGSRMWAGQQQSEPIIVEPAVAYQDPPTPMPVLEQSEAVADSMSCYTVIEYPCEEEGMQYDLEYAHVLGDEADTAELRSINSLWRAPVEVKLIDLGRSGNAGGNPQPRWRVQLPEITNLRNDVLKLALLQRVRFRLRARITPEGSTSRWWSSLSPPISTGFAGPESVGTLLVAEAGRLAVEVHFQLDLRLGEAASSAGAQELQLQREVLFQVLDSSERKPSRPKGSDEPPANQSTVHHWPRGFGHPFATRYQLCTRHFVPADVGQGEWSGWEVFPDCALPAEQPGGTVQGKEYKCSMPLPEGRDLVAGTSQHCETVQVCVRIGDGLKWSPWRMTKELPIVLEKPMASEDEAFSVWQGNVCRVAWPPAVVHAGIQEVEYQLMVVPDSAHLLPFLGAVIIAPGQQDARRNRSRKGAAKHSKSSKELPKTFPLKSVPKLVTGQARLKSVSGAHLEGLGRDDYVVAEFSDLCPDLRYAFQVSARYPTVGPRSFNKIYEVDKISRSSAPEATKDEATGEAKQVTPVPAMVQVPLLEDRQEKMQRWLQEGEGSLVLLTWPGLAAEAENPRQASVLKLSGSSASNKQYEVQAAHFKSYGEDGTEGVEWIPCPVVSAAFPFDDTTCIAVRSLPFAIGRFRLFDPQTMRAGPATPPIVTVYERVEPGRVEMIAKGEPCPRTLGAKLHIPLGTPMATGSRATCCQIRFRAMGGEDSNWKDLEVQSLPESSAIFGAGAREGEVSHVLVREDDGLELGHVYEFQVRIGDRCRIGNWSRSFHPVKFAVSPPKPPEGSGLKVVEQGDRAEMTWAPFQPDESLAAQLPGFKHLPIEYTLSVLGGSSSEPLSSICTSETRAMVHGLQPLTAYSTMLVAKWSRFGAEGRDTEHVLMAAFVTSGLGGSKLTAELSVRLPTEQLDGYGPVAPAVAKIPVQGGQPAAVTLDLDPYYVQPRLHHYNADFVRRPTTPSQRAQRSAEEEPPAAPEGQGGKLPSLVPMPPPKFTTRDPLSFALLHPVAPAPAPGARTSRPSPRRRLP